MKPIEEMTAKEIREFLYKKEREENSKVLKTGVLKEDLYCFESPNRDDSSIFIVDSYFLTEKTKDEAIKDFNDSFTLAYKKGTKLNCRPNGLWYVGETALYSRITENYIEDIQEVK